MPRNVLWFQTVSQGFSAMMVDLADPARYNFPMKNFHGEDFLINKAVMAELPDEIAMANHGASGKELSVNEAVRMDPALNPVPSPNPPLNWRSASSYPGPTWIGWRSTSPQSTLLPAYAS